MAAVLLMFSGGIAMVAALAGAAMFGLGFWGAVALFFGLGNGLALLLIAALMLCSGRTDAVRIAVSECDEEPLSPSLSL